MNAILLQKCDTEVLSHKNNTYTVKRLVILCTKFYIAYRVYIAFSPDTVNNYI